MSLIKESVNNAPHSACCLEINLLRSEINKLLLQQERQRNELIRLSEQFEKLAYEFTKSVKK